ncbi:MAG: N-acetylornithine carbamoyltransferase [Rhodobacterales bacterium]|nr:N-acetylornithine carbamoyltransferase [Rhodobacterales bacterium]
MTLNRFLDLSDLSDDQIQGLLSRARYLQENPRHTTLQGRVAGLVFLNPSLRTLASMQAGIAQLGGSSFVIQPGNGTWALETQTGVVMDGNTAEHVREAIPVLEQYCDLLGVRCFAQGKDLEHDLSEPILGTFADAASKPLINLESATNHPCQALADWKTLDDLKVPSNGKFVLSWANHPKALPMAVPAAVAGMAARRGMDLTILRPEGFALPSAMMTKIRGEAVRSGGSVQESNDRADLEGAHVLYAKSWGSAQAYGDIQAEAELRAQYPDWTVTPSWFETTRPEASFLHCLPVRRNVVVSDAVLDSERSKVVLQAGNRLHAQKALMWSMLEAK